MNLPEEAGLPIQGRPERLHLYRWMYSEENYVAGKFDDQRDGHDETLKQYNLNAFWIRQIVQYLDRAQAFLDSAADPDIDAKDRRQLEMLAQQAMAKCMMTAKGLVESSIRVYGPMPKPGVSSGYIEPWGDTVEELLFIEPEQCRCFCGMCWCCTMGHSAPVPGGDQPVCGEAMMMRALRFYEENASKTV